MAAFGRVPGEDWEELARVLDAGVEDLSREAQALALERASRRLRVGQLDAHDEEHLRVVWDELRTVVLRASLERLAAKGQLKIVGIADDGHLLYERPGPSPAEAREDTARRGSRHE